MPPITGVYAEILPHISIGGILWLKLLCVGAERHPWAPGSLPREAGQLFVSPHVPRPGDKWHLDEMFLTINGARHDLWRAVDQDGNGLDILMQRWRDTHAAKTFFRKLLKGLRYVPRLINGRPHIQS